MPAPRNPLRVVAALAALLSLGAAPDPERAIVPLPSPRPIAPAGRVLFADDFSSGSLERWQPDRDSVWSALRGLLRGDLPDGKQTRSLIYAGSEDWTDYAVDLDVCQIRGVDKGVVVRARGGSGVGVDLRGPGYHDLLLYHRALPLGRARVENGNAVWHHLRVEARGNHYVVYVNGARVLDRPGLGTGAPRGRIALPAYNGGVGQCTVFYDNVVVTELK